MIRRHWGPALALALLLAVAAVLVALEASAHAAQVVRRPVTVRVTQPHRVARWYSCQAWRIRDSEVTARGCIPVIVPR